MSAVINLMAENANRPSNERLNLDECEDCQIPIHVYYVTNEDGDEQNAEGYTLDIFAAHLEEANTFFTNGISFYICQATPIVNTAWFDAIESNVGVPYLSEFVNVIHDDNAISIYFRRGVDFWAGNLNAMSINYVSGPTTIAHELGHSLGLTHTFLKTVDPGTPTIDPCIRIFPNNTCNDFCLANCEIDPTCTSDITLGKCTGDYIGDTGVDISTASNNAGGGTPTDFCLTNEMENPCIVTINQVDFEYDIPYGNIMSYLPNRSHFTAGQLEFMTTTLQMGDKQYLIDDNVPECEDFDFINPFVSEVGRIEAPKYDATTNNYEYVPLVDVFFRIKNIEEDINCLKLSDEDGYYETMASPCSFVVPRYLSDESIELGRCTNICAQLEVTNGISALDITKINRHILGINTPNIALPKPYAEIAADVNNSGTITASDIIEIRKLLLGIIDEFEAVRSWRFLPRYTLDAQWNFENDFETNPFSAVWDINGEQRAYLANGTTKSYLDKINFNTLNEGVGKESTWSFIGIKSGDVTFNANTDDPTFAPENPAYFLTGLPHDCINAGEKFTVSFESTGSNWSDLEAYQMGMIIDPALANATGVNAGDLAGFSLNNFNGEKLKQGELRTLWYNQTATTTNLAEGTVLFKLQLTALTKICDISTVFAFDNRLLMNTVYGSSNDETKGLEIKLEVTNGGRKHKLKNIFPNPAATGALSFEFELEEAAMVKIMLWDPFGTLKEESQYFDAGEHTFLLNNTSTLQSGALHYIIELGDEVNTGNLIKL